MAALAESGTKCKKGVPDPLKESEQNITQCMSSHRSNGKVQQEVKKNRHDHGHKK